MQYPQAYLFIDNGGKPLNYKWLKGLADNAPIYISKQSRRSREMEEQIAVMSDAATIVGRSRYAEKNQLAAARIIV